ncbi:FtsZ/tubulin family protein [Ornithinibacillus californiensis]|uniref:cell division protein FtsZ n=1 Tax=Ornithinibacillus californiensis TaxID=161536 RepID=UPI00064DDFD4|nr:cell division protein FtsZ [Ornithinibacillus californiensis]
MERIFGPFRLNTDFSDKRQSIIAELQQDDLCFYRFIGGNPSETQELGVKLKNLRERKPLLIGVFRFPFRFEGKRRQMTAKEQYYVMRDYCDAVIFFDSDGLMETIDPNTPIHEARQAFDKIEEKSMQTLREMVDETGKINIDYQDIKTFINRNRGPLFVHTIEGRNFDEPLKYMIATPYLPNDFTEAEQLIINIGYTREVDMEAFRQINLRLNDLFDKAELFKIGSYFIDEPGQRFKITLLVNGIQDPIETPILSDKKPSIKYKNFIRKWLAETR